MLIRMTAAATSDQAPTLEVVTVLRLADQVAEQLRRYIVGHELGPGDRLPSERDLAAMMAISRTTVSQAVRTLAIAGLVEVRHGSGAYVRRRPGDLLGVSFDLMFDAQGESLDELVEFSAWIERGLLDLRAPREFNPGELCESFSDLERAHESVSAYTEADARFHTAVVAGGGNRYLTALFEAVHRKILHITYSSWIESGRRPDWLEEHGFGAQIDLHRRIMDAAFDGDDAALELALADHRRVLGEHLEPVRK